MTITIFTSVGKQIFYKNDILHSIDISDFKAGVYYIKIQLDDDYNIQKLIIL